MKKISKPQPGATTAADQPPASLNSEAAITAAPAPIHGIKFPVAGLNSISASLPVRTLKRTESRLSFRLGRCALLSLLLTGILTAGAHSLWNSNSSGCSPGNLIPNQLVSV